jgi:hypothetical protein
MSEARSEPTHSETRGNMARPDTTPSARERCGTRAGPRTARERRTGPNTRANVAGTTRGNCGRRGTETHFARGTNALGKPGISQGGDLSVSPQISGRNTDLDRTLPRRWVSGSQGQASHFPRLFSGFPNSPSVFQRFPKSLLVRSSFRYLREDFARDEVEGCSAAGGIGVAQTGRRIDFLRSPSGPKDNLVTEARQIGSVVRRMPHAHRPRHGGIPEGSIRD